MSLILRCVYLPETVNQTFLVSDDYDLSTTELLQACAAAFGEGPRLIPVPQRLIEIDAMLAGKQSFAEWLCGFWTPPFSVMDGLIAAAHNLSQGKK